MKIPSAICVFAHLSRHQLEFCSILLPVPHFSLLFHPLLFFLFFFWPLSRCTAIWKYSWKQGESWKLLYAVKYFSGISHVDPFTAGSITLELSHFRRKILLRRSRESCRIWRYVSASSSLWSCLLSHCRANSLRSWRQRKSLSRLSKQKACVTTLIN